MPGPRRLLAAYAGLALLAGAAGVHAQPEIPSSAPAPGPKPSPPPLTAPGDSDGGQAGANDRAAAQAAVRAQCVADRAKFCRDSSGVGALACLSGRFDSLSPNCQSAVTALREAQRARPGG